MNFDVPVVILCGGQGTRIRDVSESLPKPMLPIGGYPILWHIMRIYAAHGYRRFVLALGYKSWVIKEYFLNLKYMHGDFHIRFKDPVQIDLLADRQPLDWSVTFAETGELSQTGARVLACERYVDTEDFMVTYGDGVADVDVLALHRFHEAHGRLGTVTGVRPAGRFGALVTKGSQVVEFSEKKDAGGGLINGGFFVFKRGFFEILRGLGDTMLETQPMKELVAKGQLEMYNHPGFWEPMDTQREQLLLNRLWSEGAAPWKTWS
jgi:glucose-1-phosphate cytidylyltransferase